MVLTPTTEAAELAEESSGVLRRVLALVDAGDLDVIGQAGVRLVERLRMSADALDRIAMIHRERALTGQRITPNQLLDLLVGEPHAEVNEKGEKGQSDAD